MSGFALHRLEIRDRAIEYLGGISLCADPGQQSIIVAHLREFQEFPHVGICVRHESYLAQSDDSSLELSRSQMPDSKRRAVDGGPYDPSSYARRTGFRSMHRTVIIELL